MAEENKIYGDEQFIHHMAMQQENPERQNDIRDGHIMIDDVKIPFKRTGIIDERMTIIMPETFEIMPKKQFEEKYSTEDCPDIAYTFLDDDIHFTLTYKNDAPAEDEDIADMKNLVQKMVMRSFPASKVIESETLDVSGRSVAYFDFDSEVYNLLFFFSLDGGLIMGSMECVKSLINDWKPVLLQMIGSIEENEIN